MRISTAQFSQMSTNSILDQQSKLLRNQQQLASGKRILTPADDPAGATRILELQKSIKNVEQYNRNLNQAELALRTEESALEQAGNLLQRVRELTVQALNDSQDGANRRIIAGEIEQLRDELVQLANTKDGTGEYLFAGTSSRTAPFATEGGGVSYAGNQVQRTIQAGATRQLPTHHTGYEVFMKVPVGNGEFTVSATAGNTGSGVIDAGRTRDGSTPFDGPYTIEFSENAGGDLEYTVSNPGGVVTGPEPFVSGESISFNGRQVAISGSPNDGDTFQVEEAGFNSLFSTLSNLMDAMGRGGAGETSADRINFQNVGGVALTDLDRALDHLLDTRAEVGARLNTIDNELDANESYLLDLETAKSGIEDLDYAEAISEFTLRQVGLQAAQQSYVQIQGLSLFNFL
ncbi:MAG: flagellar hook-associated protein FlgL [Ectothiorhodospiraceae bacterium]|nr:flagellar hook-associated protein FlgL [Ectothiorhodospiraceae bacterium]MCH8504594.1 flagellar hook-associated protein FlgL [Ectothiorhodospiraceae bacterium]